jgi:hypothetical protein
VLIGVVRMAMDIRNEAAAGQDLTVTRKRLLGEWSPIPACFPKPYTR